MVVVVLGSVIVVVEAVVGPTVVAGVAAVDGWGSPTEGLAVHPATRTRVRSSRLDVGAADDEAHENPADQRPDEREVIAHRIYGGTAGYPHDGGEGYATDDADQDGPDQAVRRSYETPDQATDGADQPYDHHCEEQPPRRWSGRRRSP